MNSCDLPLVRHLLAVATSHATVMRVSSDHTRSQLMITYELLLGGDIIRYTMIPVVFVCVCLPYRLP